jgi:uncharacterized membrane protein YphA (DoxX/SURF4 family)
VTSDGAAAPAEHRRFSGSELQKWLSTLARVLLGLVLLAASLLKIADPHQAAAAVQAYQLLPSSLAEYVGYGLPLVEFFLAVALLLGLGTRLAAWITAGLMVIFIFGVASAWARGLSIDCGCFGGGGVVAKGHTKYLQEILRDVVFIGLAVWLIRFPMSRLALDRSGRAGTGDQGLFDEFDDDDYDDDAADAADDLAAADRPETTEEPRA